MQFTREYIHKYLWPVIRKNTVFKCVRNAVISNNFVD